MASLTALSMFPPNAARPPVNGSTLPIRSVNEQLAPGAAVDAVAATAAAEPTAASTSVARLTLLDVSTELPPVGRPAVPPACGGAQCCDTDRYFARRQERRNMLAEVDVRAPAGSPDVGAVIRRLRTQRGVSVRALAQSAGLSASFLGAVERGDSVLQSAARFVEPARRGARGEGVEFSAFRIPGSHLELLVASFAPRSGFDDSITHAGIDVAYVAQGRLVLVVDDVEYELVEGQCVVWPSSHPHTMRNASDEPAIVVGFATEIVH